MALILTFVNVTEGGIRPEDDSQPVSKYNWGAFINNRQIDGGTVESHRRSDGWKALVRKAIDSPGVEK